MKNIWILVKNTMKVTFRKKGNILVYLFLPILGVLISMMIYSGAGSGHMYLGYVDKDKSTFSSDIISALTENENYKVSEISESEIKGKLLDGMLGAVIVIPEGYGDSVFKNDVKTIEVASLKGQESTVWIENFLNLNSQNLSSMAFAAGGDKSKFDNMYNSYKEGSLKLKVEKLKDTKTNQNITVFSIGFLIMFTMLGSSFTSQIILKEKRERTYYRICSAPVKFREYIASNTITSLIIVSVQTVFIQLLLKYVFRIETYVPGLMMFLILFLFGLVSIGIGMIITAYSSSSYISSTISTLVMTPTCMLGGCFWPIEYMPDVMKKIAFFTPQWWTLDAIKKIQIGGSLYTIMLNLAILLAFAAALLLIAIYRFSRTDNVQKFV